MNNVAKSAAAWAVIIILILFVVLLREQKTEPPQDLSYSKLLDGVHSGAVSSVQIQARDPSQGGGLELRGELNGEPFVAYTTDREVHQALRDAGVEIKESPFQPKYLQRILWEMIPIVLIIGVIWYFAYRQMQSGGNKALSFGKSRAKMHSQNQNKVTFDDVAGVNEAKDELQEIIDFLREPKKYTRIGGKIPKGVLLMGPPGCGKTLLARAVAGEAKVPFFALSGSDFVEMFVGVGASRVRDLFAQGQKHAPCIIFIDELDAVGRQRGAGLGGGHDEREQTLNQLLVEMDGFNSNEGVILMAATNRPDVLDKALLRPGRFDRQIVVDNPDLQGREQILHVHTKRVPLGNDVELSTLARGTPGFSGADLANMVNEGALLAARHEKDQVEMVDFEEAKDRVLMGPERRSMFISEKEKRMTAFHEAGHALVGALLPNTDPVHKVTIIPRGRALGLTQHLPIEDRHSYSRSYLTDLLAMMLGGRAAEEITFGEMTSGAGNDIQKATELARRMVCEWGMSEALGPISFGSNDEVFLGRDFLKERNYSEEVARRIDEEIRRLVQAAHQQGIQLLTEHNDLLNRVANALIEFETLEGHQLEAVIAGQEMPPPMHVSQPRSPDPPTSGEADPSPGDEEPGLPPTVPDPAPA